MWKLKYNTFSEFSNDNSNEKSNDIRYSTDIQYKETTSSTGEEQFSNDNNENPISNWDNSEYLLPFYNSFVKELGEPSYIVNERKGIVCWNNSETTPWAVEHYLRDEKVSHCVPANHTDFFYTSVNIYVPEDKVPDVQSISGSVMLDLLKNTVTARCGSTGANYATIRTVIDVIEGEFTREDISANYSNNINNMSADKNSNIDKIKKFISNTTVPNNSYHPFAFPDGCPPKKTEQFYNSKNVPQSHIPKNSQLKYKKYKI